MRDCAGKSPAAAGDTTTQQRIERSGCSEPTDSTLPVGSESPSACTRQRPPLSFSDVDRASSKCRRPASSPELVQAVKRLQVETVLSAIRSSISKTAIHRPWRRAGRAPTPASCASRQAGGAAMGSLNATTQPPPHGIGCVRCASAGRRAAGALRRQAVPRRRSRSWLATDEDGCVKPARR